MGISYAENAARGARLLDKKCPGWYDKVDLSSLDMRSLCNCMLGQLYGDFMKGVDRVCDSKLPPYPDASKSRLRFEYIFGFEAVPHGIKGPNDDLRLRREWEKIILARREAVCVSA